MALFNDYDRNYRYGAYNRGVGYDRDLGDRMAGGARRGWNKLENGARDAVDMGGYDRNYVYGAGAPNRGGYGAGYDQDYKSRWETDYGDPFGDRSSRTPIRMTRGEYNAPGYDRGYGNPGYSGGYSGVGYDRDYGVNPMSYDPYANRGGYTRADRNVNYGRGNEYGAGRGYDRGF